MMLRESIGGNTAHLSPPDDKCVGWEFVADNGPYVAIGPRLFSTVAHIGVHDQIVYRGESYQRLSTMIEPGNDCRFIQVDRDLPDWAEPYVADDFKDAQSGSIHQRELYCVGMGHGYGTIEDGVRYFFGTVGSEAMRWCYSDSLQYYGGTILWRFNEGASSSQDSGYGVFIVHEGRLKYLGQMVGGNNPSILDGFWSIVNMGPWLFKELLAPHFAPRPTPTAPVITNPHMEFVFNVTASQNHTTRIEFSEDHTTWTPLTTGKGNFTFREEAKDASMRIYRATTIY